MCNNTKFKDGYNEKTINKYIGYLERNSEIITKHSINDKKFDFFCFKGDDKDLDALYNFTERFLNTTKTFTDSNAVINHYKAFTKKHLQSINGVESTIEIPL